MQQQHKNEAVHSSPYQNLANDLNNDINRMLDNV
jgi:hypothetical protein